MILFALFAAKSVVIAGGTLLVLRCMRGRSASDRSWIAHLGLAALAALPLGSMLFPPLEVSAAGWKSSPASVPQVEGVVPGWMQTAATADWLLVVYASLALVLLARTLLALLRLVLLTARARPVTDAHWLEALARARRRTGFTNGVALLVSSEIASPVSWGAQRPRILLNAQAVAARTDADAILAHELAHAGRADWAKLMLARVSVALFWFNPLAWLLARAAHQLREEAADDAVLAADIDHTAYASLLVSAARRHGNALLLGAHGVAPARSSLAHRVRRVLDRDLDRSAGSTRWAASGAAVMGALAAPLMALQLTDPAPAFGVGDAAEVVVFDLRAPSAGSDALPYSARGADAAEVQSNASANQGRTSAGSAIANRPLQDGGE